MSSGGPERFDALYEEHYRAVLAFALRRVRAAEAEDIAAETFMVAWRRLDRVPEDALPWLLGVARNQILHLHRSAGRQQALLDRVGGEWSPEWREPGSDGDVLAAVAQLPVKEREVVMLVCWEGLSPSEAARVLGISAVSARVRLHRARGRLKAALGAWLPEAGTQEAV